jgi:putative transcriptional regulator
MKTETLTNNLKVHRAVKDWTQEELSRRVGVTRKTINTIERGKYVPSTVLALKLARVFDVAVEDLFSCEETTTSKANSEVDPLSSHEP